MTPEIPLAPCSVYASPRWLEVHTRGGRAPGRILTAPDAAGAPRAWLPLHDRPPTRNPRYASETLFRGFPEVPPAATLVGLASGYQTDLAMLQGADVLRAVFAEAVPADRPLVVPFAVQRLADALVAGFPGATRVLEAADAWLLAPTSADDRLAALPARERGTVLHDLRRFAASGLAHEVVPLGPHVPGFAELVAAHAARYGLDEPADGLAAHLGDVARVFGDDAVLFAAFRGPRLVAGALGLVHGEHVYMRMVGNDHDAVAGTAAHFVLTYHRPVAWGAARGLRGVHLGLSVDRTKRARGAILTPLWTVVLGPHAPPADPARLHAERLAEIAAADPGTAAALAERA